jgi:hypothetical protein
MEAYVNMAFSILIRKNTIDSGGISSRNFASQMDSQVAQ